MSSGRASRAELLAALIRALRWMSNEDVLFTQALVDRLGLNLTDFICLSMLEAGGAMSAGRLAELTGLTTGAITGVLDRLEKAGFARRGKDPKDRRVVIIEAVKEREQDFEQLFAPLGQALRQMLGGFTVEQLGVLNIFVQRTAEVLQQERVRLRSEGAAAGAVQDGSWAPLDGAKAGRLRFNTGAAKVTVRGDPRVEELYRAKFEGRPPLVKVDGGNVTIAYQRFGLFEWRKLGVEVALNTTLPWRLEFQGGVSRVEADLSEALLSGMVLTGGVMEVHAVLPRPAGIVPVVVTGGAANVRIERPRGAAVRVEVKGGVGNVELDGQQFGGVGGHTTLASPGAGEAADRYDVVVSGGASNVVVTSR